MQRLGLPAEARTVRMDPKVSSATVEASALDVSCSLMYLTRRALDTGQGTTGVSH